MRIVAIATLLVAGIGLLGASSVFAEPAKGFPISKATAGFSGIEQVQWCPRRCRVCRHHWWNSSTRCWCNC